MINLLKILIICHAPFIYTYTREFFGVGVCSRSVHVLCGFMRTKQIFTGYASYLPVYCAIMV